MRTQPIIESIVRSPLLWENIREGSFIYFPFDCLTDLTLICINLNQFIVHHWTVFKPLYTSLRVIERGISVDIDLVIWSDKSITHLKKTIAKLKTRQYFDKEHILSGILCSLSRSWSLECYATAAIFLFLQQRKPGEKYLPWGWAKFKRKETGGGGIIEKKKSSRFPCPSPYCTL